MTAERKLADLLGPCIGWLPPKYRLLARNYSIQSDLSIDPDFAFFISAISHFAVGELVESESHADRLMSHSDEEISSFAKLLSARIKFSQNELQQGIEFLETGLESNTSIDNYTQSLNLLNEFSLPRDTVGSRLSQKGHPQAIFVQLLTECNARCNFCPHPFTYHRGKVHQQVRMNDRIWDNIVEELIKEGYAGKVGFYPHFEPLLYKDLHLKIRDINEFTNGHVVLSTNGYLLTDNNIEKLKNDPSKKIHTLLL